MYTEIIFEKDGERQKWRGTFEGFKSTNKQATIIKVSKVDETY